VADFRWKQSAVITADGNVKGEAGFVKSILVGWKGAAAGEFVALVNHATLTTPIGAPPIVFDGANGVRLVEFSGEGLYFDTAIRVNKGATAGSVWVIVQFK
jgi:hypothetical protein